MSLRDIPLRKLLDAATPIAVLASAVLVGILLAYLITILPSPIS